MVVHKVWIKYNELERKPQFLSRCELWFPVFDESIMRRFWEGVTCPRCTFAREGYRKLSKRKHRRSLTVEILPGQTRRVDGRDITNRSSVSVFITAGRLTTEGNRPIEVVQKKRGKYERKSSVPK